jgi:hypothetical protein
MSRSSRGPSTKSYPSDTFTSNLNAYALVAGAAGVSLLAMIQPAEAEVVFTPTNKVLPNNLGLLIDLNHDGTRDFELVEGTFQYHSWWNDLDIRPHAENGIMESSKGYAALLVRGAPIGAGQNFERGHNVPLLNSRGFQYGSTTSRKAFRKGYSRHIYGPWQYAQDNYLGVTFTIDGVSHFGWLRLSVSIGFRRFTTTINGFAYETIPGKTIYAGQLSEHADALPESMPDSKASLGALALGSRGLKFWRGQALSSHAAAEPN